MLNPCYLVGMLQGKAVEAGLPDNWGFTALDSQSSTTTSSNSGSAHLSGGAIAGIVVGAVVFTGLMALAGFFAVRHLAAAP